MSSNAFSIHSLRRMNQQRSRIGVAKSKGVLVGVSRARRLPSAYGAPGRRIRIPRMKVVETDFR
jgi:hypothetical protein